MPRRLTQRTAHNRYSWHVATLAYSHGITLYLDDKPKPYTVDQKGKRTYEKDHVSPFADMFYREVHTYPIKNVETYAIALHEIGHLLDPTLAQLSNGEKLRAPDNLNLPLDLSFLTMIITGSCDRWYQLRAEWRAWYIADQLSMVEMKTDRQFQKAMVSGLSSYATKEEWDVIAHACMAEWSIRNKEGSEYPKKKTTRSDWEILKSNKELFKRKTKIWTHDPDLVLELALEDLHKELGSEATDQDILTALSDR
jgi:hypothetical protein